MTRLLSFCTALLFSIATPALAHDTYDTYDAPYSGPYVGDGYKDWHPEFRSRAARYRRDRRYYDDDYYEYKRVRRRHAPRRYRGGEYEEEFWIGNCKIEREWERDGSYEEEIDCD